MINTPLQTGRGFKRIAHALAGAWGALVRQPAMRMSVIAGFLGASWLLFMYENTGRLTQKNLAYNVEIFFLQWSDWLAFGASVAVAAFLGITFVQGLSNLKHVEESRLDVVEKRHPFLPGKHMLWFLLVLTLAVLSFAIVQPVSKETLASVATAFVYPCLLLFLLGNMGLLLCIEWMGIYNSWRIDDEKLNVIESRHPYLPQAKNILLAMLLTATFPIALSQAHAQIVELTDHPLPSYVQYTEQRSWQIANDADNVSITGTVYTNTGGTIPLTGVTVAASLNGAAAAGTDAVDAGGQYTITGLTLTGGTIITLYIDGAATHKAVTVSTGSGGHMTGATLIKNNLIIRSGTGTGLSVGSPVTSTSLDVANNNGDTDITAIYTMSSLNTTVVNNKRLNVMTGSALSLGGTLAIGTAANNAGFHLNGNFNQNSNDITLFGPFTQSGGTFRGGANTITVSHDFTLDAGQFIATSGTMTFNGGTQRTFTINSPGTFTHNSGTVQTTGNNFTVDIPTSMTMYNLIVSFNANSRVFDMAAVDTIIVAGALTLTNGEINDGTFNATGSAPSIASTFDGGDGILQLSGASAQSFTVGSGAVLPSITLNQSATTINFTSGTGGIDGSLTLTAGTFVAPSDSLNFTNGSAHFLAITNGTFTHNGGTVRVNGHDITTDLASSVTLNNLVVNSTSATRGFKIAAGDHVKVLGRTILNNGVFSVTGMAELQGDVYVASGFDGGTGGPKFSGSSNQIFANTGGTVPTGNWTIAKTAGSLTLGSGALTLNTSGQDLFLTGGTLDLNGYNITVNDRFDVGTGTTLRLTGDETLTGGPDRIQRSATVWYDDAGGTTQLKNLTYQNLTIGSTGSTVFKYPTNTGQLNLSGSLTISGGTLTVTNGQNLRFSGSWLKTSAANAGFTAGTGTVTLFGGDQTMSGSNTFYNLTKSVTTPQTLTFAATATQTISNTLTLNGASSNLLSLRSSQTGTKWRIDPQATRTVSYLDVKDGNNIHATIINPTSSSDSGNNTNWFASSITGTVYSDTGASLPLTGVTVGLSLNAAAATTMSVDGGGQFSFTGLTMTGGTIVTVWVDGGTTAQRAVTVSLGSGSSMSGITLIKDNLIVRSGTGATYSPVMTSHHMAIAKRSNSNDSDITSIFSMSSDNLTVATGKRMTLFNSGTVLSMSGTLTASRLHIRYGTIRQGSNKFTISTALTQSGGIFSGGTETINITGTNLTIWGGVFTSTSSGLLLGTANFTHTNGGTFAHNSGTVAWNLTSSAGPTIDIATTETFYNLTMVGSGINRELNIPAADTLVVNGTFTWTSGAIDTGTVDAKGTVVIGAGAGGYDITESTLLIAGSGTQTCTLNAGGTVSNLTIGNPQVLCQATGTGTITAERNLIITGGTLSLKGSNLTVTSIFTVGTGSTFRLHGGETLTGGPDFIHKNSTIWYNEPSITRKIKNIPYQNLVIGSTGSAIFQYPINNGQLNLSGSLTISGGTLTVTNGQNLNLSGSFIKKATSNAGFSAGTGQVLLSGKDQTLSGSIVFYNLSKTVSAPRTLTFSPDGVKAVSGALTLRGASSNLLSLRSATTNVAARLLLDGDAGTQTIDYLDVKDNNATGGQALTCLTDSEGCVNSGGNTNWSFSAAAVAAGTGTVKGVVWNDNDGDGVKDAGETTGLNGVSVALAGTTGTGMALNRSTTTASTGQFFFSGALVSNSAGYTVTVNSNAAPAGYIRTRFNSSGSNIVGTGTIIDARFGYVLASTISGAVFIDTDKDGVKDAGEGNGLNGVTMSLSGTSSTGGSVLGSASTSGFGTYTFSGLPPSSLYTVAVSSGVPARYVATTATSTGVNVPVGNTSVQNAHVGYYWYGTMSGVVFIDINRNGALDGGETGRYAGAIISLTGTTSTGAVINKTRISSSTGAFFFGNMPISSGNYTTTITVPTNHSATTAISFDKAITVGTDASSTSFGLAYHTGTGTVKGTVWNDSDGDGVKDSGETTGLNGVGIALTGTTGTGMALNRSTTTAATGQFFFSGALVSNSAGYTITVNSNAAPAGYIRTRFNSSGSNIVGTGTIIDARFGYVLPSTISGAVFIDTDKDGVKDGGETSGLNAVSLSLSGTSATGGTVQGSASTNSSGIYSFGGLPPTATTYTASVTSGIPAGYVPSFSSSTGVTLAVGGTSRQDAHIGYYWYGTMSGVIFVDTNRNGAIDGGETGRYPGATVTVTGTTSTGAAINKTRISSSTGAFFFGNMPISSGNYAVTLTVPSYQAASTATSFNRTITAGSHAASTPFGLYPITATGTVKGTVWNDENGDGVKDAGEVTGLNAVSVALTGTTGTGMTVNKSTTTNSAGQYFFSGSLLSNSAGYTVTVNSNAAPTGYIRTRFNSSGSNVLGSGGIVDVRFGYVLPSSLSGSVFVDTDQDGIKDGGETEVFSGASLTLTGTSGTGGTVSQTAVSNASGTYVFRNLPTSNGSFLLVITPPTGYSSTTTNSRSIAFGTGGQIKFSHFGYIVTPAGSSSSSAASTSSSDSGGGDAGGGGGRRGDEPIVVTITPTEETPSGSEGEPEPVDDREEIVSELRDLREMAEERRKLRAANLADTVDQRVQEVKDSLNLWPVSNVSVQEPSIFMETLAIIQQLPGKVVEVAQDIADVAAQQREAFQDAVSYITLGVLENTVDVAYEAGKIGREWAEEVYEVSSTFNKGVSTMATYTVFAVRDMTKTFGTVGEATYTTIATAVGTTGDAIAYTSISIYQALQDAGERMTERAVQIAENTAIFAQETFSEATGVRDALTIALNNIGQKISGEIEASIELALMVGSDVVTGAQEAVEGVVDNVAYTIVAFSDDTREVAIRTVEGAQLFALRLFNGISEEEIALPEPEQYTTEIAKKENRIVVARLHMSVLNSFGDPYMNTPVVLFSTPKIAITDDEGIATFNEVEVGNHRLEIHVEGQDVETRDIIIEPPSGMSLEEQERIQAVLPVIQVIVEEPMHAAARSRTDMILWLVVVLLGAGNVSWISIWIWKRGHRSHNVEKEQTHVL